MSSTVASIMLEIDQLLLTLPQKPAEWRDARGGDGFDRKRRRWEKGDNPDPGSIVDFAESLWAFVHRVGNKEIAAFTFKRLCELVPDGNKGWMEQDARTDLKQRELMFVEWFVGLRKKGRITYSRRLEAEASLRESPEQMQPKETRIPGPADEAKTAGLNEQVGRFVQVRIAKGLSEWSDLTGELEEWRREANIEEEDPALWRKRFSKREFILKCERFFWGGTLGKEKPAFEVLFVNEAPVDLVITSVGIRVLDAEHHMYTAGESAPERIPIAGDYEIGVPSLVSWERGREETMFPFSAKHELADPLFASPGTPFRYIIRMDRAASDAANAVLLRFFVETNRGTSFSELIYLQN